MLGTNPGSFPIREDVAYLIDKYGIMIASAKPETFLFLVTLSNRLEILSVRIVEQLERLRFLRVACATR
jgi:hypothetical protein